jgi:hypothetical protein
MKYAEVFLTIHQRVRTSTVKRTLPVKTLKGTKPGKVLTLIFMGECQVGEDKIGSGTDNYCAFLDPRKERVVLILRKHLKTSRKTDPLLFPYHIGEIVLARCLNPVTWEVV